MSATQNQTGSRAKNIIRATKEGTGTRNRISTEQRWAAIEVVSKGNNPVWRVLYRNRQNRTRSPPHTNARWKRIRKKKPKKLVAPRGHTQAPTQLKPRRKSAAGMMTLQEQCIRVLQNNIDSIGEVGGVPFEILEPVLERCTPEQLYRIEQSNQWFIEDSDELWMRHCQREFKRETPQEYESWRELYLRLHDEREERLKLLTHNISTAHANKPKGSGGFCQLGYLTDSSSALVCMLKKSFTVLS
ncbi:unnamed protein product [Tetraodon nigroviridis]|uniref:Elongin-A n=1 Tax=Tetraodon nigroviridis TaxID=99883 RepID=Q4SAL1_TETNG|nr:unnamed protein product [Tetraodon nigroviridis]